MNLETESEKNFLTSCHFYKLQILSYKVNQLNGFLF